MSSPACLESTDLAEIAAATIAAFKADKTYREFTSLTCSPIDGFPIFLTDDGSSVINFSSNNYLALSFLPAAQIAAIQAILSDGLGAGGSRNIGGTRKTTTDLEQELCALHGTEAALTFNSGYQANAVSMKVAAQYGAKMFSDQNNHASIIDGLSGGRTDKFIFEHNNVNHLEELLRREADSSRPSVVAFETLYSMDGDTAPVADLIRVSHMYGARVFLNEVHAVGAIGDGGAGIASANAAADGIDLVMGTFGKAFGTAGGYIAGQSHLVDLIRCTGRAFIFTTAQSPAITAATLANVRHLRASCAERNLLLARNRRLRAELARRGVPVFAPSDRHIVSVQVGDEGRTVAISQALLAKGYYVTPIRYPTVARGDGRLRVTVTPAHSEDMIVSFANALSDVL